MICNSFCFSLCGTGSGSSFGLRSNMRWSHTDKVAVLIILEVISLYAGSGDFGIKLSALKH